MTSINSTEYYKVICEEVQRHLEDSEVSKLSHFHAAAILERNNRWLIGLPATVFAIILAWIVNQEKTTNNDIINIVKTSLSLIVPIFTGTGAFLNLNESASQHRKAALKYQEICRKCRNWTTDFPDDSNLSEARKIVQSYRDQITNINQESPQIPKWAWKSVNKQRKEGSTKYEQLLPLNDDKSNKKLI